MGYIVARTRASSDHWLCQLQEANNGSVLLVGPRQVGKYTLAKRLLQPAAAREDADGQEIWHLDTKYYSADVSIHRSHPSGHAYQQATDSQGIVLVFAADSETSFQAVSQWAEQLPSSAGEIKLCVANKADTIAAQQTGACELAESELRRSSWLTSAIMWCAEHQYEYIEASSTNNQLDQNLVWEEQKQGIHRIKQALEANYWPNLVMKQLELNHAESPQQGGYALSQTASTADQENEDSCSSSHVSDQEGHDISQFQSAEEAQLDQFDKMFGELRGEFLLLQLLLLWTIVTEPFQLMLS